MKFYNVKTRKSVLVEDSKCTKVKYVKGDKVTYAARCIVEGTPCTRFLTKAAYDELKCKEA